MLSLPDQSLIVKLSNKNGESTTVMLRMFHTESLGDHPGSGRPVLRADRVHVVQSVMENLAAETSSGSSSAREA